MTAVSFERSVYEEWASARWTIRPARVLVLALVVFGFGNMLRIPLLDFGSRQAPLTVNDIAVGLLLASGVLAMAKSRVMRLNDVALAAIVFAGVGGLSALGSIPKYGLSWFEVIASLAYLARWCVYFGTYLVVINCLREPDVVTAWKTIERVFIAMAVFGILQSTFLPNFAYMLSPSSAMYDWDKQGNRLVSTILDPNIMAGLLNVILLIQLSQMAFGIKVPLWKPLLMLAALFMTLSRGGVLSLAVGVMCLLVVKKPSRRILRLSGIVAAALAVAAPFLIEFGKQYGRFSLTDDSAMARVFAWQRAFETFLESPWYGVGFNTYGFVQDHRGFERLGAHTYSAEGGLLFIAVMTGLIGLSVYLVMLWCVFKRCRRGWRNGNAMAQERALFLGVGVATISVLVDTLFVNTLLVVFMMELLWILWGMTFVLHESVRKRQSTAVA